MGGYAVLLAAFSSPVAGAGKGERATKGDVSGCFPPVSGREGVNAAWLWGAGEAVLGPPLPRTRSVLEGTGALPTAPSTKAPAGRGEEGW